MTSPNEQTSLDLKGLNIYRQVVDVGDCFVKLAEEVREKAKEMVGDYHVYLNVDNFCPTFGEKLLKVEGLFRYKTSGLL